MARDAVFRSWMNARAIEYRRIYDIPDHIGTAVNVQMMVFGNTGDRSATGVGFTRNPATGAKEFYGEFLINAQGEDVVAGIRTPQPIRELEQVMPKAYKQLREITTRLEKHYKDVQDFEFTIQDERLFMLQTRSGKRTGYAAVVIATDLVAEKLITPKEARPARRSRVAQPAAGARASIPTSGRRFRRDHQGLPASPGAASGQVVFSADHAVEWTQSGQAGDSRPARNGAGRHPRHVRRAGHSHGDRRHDLARRGRRPPDGKAVRRRRRRARNRRDRRSSSASSGKTVKEGDYHLVRRPDRRGEDRARRVEAERDPAGGQRHAEPAKKSDIYQRFDKLLSWADKFRRLGIRANADLPDQAELAYAFGARGIGLCRTEHMFFGEGRIPDRSEDDSRRQRSRSAQGARPSCCRCSATTSTASSRRCTAAR